MYTVTSLVIVYARPSTSRLNTLDAKTQPRSKAMYTTLLYANYKLPYNACCVFSCRGKIKPNFWFWPIYGQNNKSIPHLTSRVPRLLSDRLLCCNEAILASYPFLGFLLLGVHTWKYYQKSRTQRTYRWGSDTFKLTIIFTSKKESH